MTGIVIRTVEELRAVAEEREHPTIIIAGELANNLLISGVLREMGGGKPPQVVGPKEPDSLFHPIARILKHLSHSNVIEFIQANGGRQIKISPRPFVRREGN